ncbi:hypothetical protein B0H63DRAFT_552650 [Podospora didyma]|uniref:Uncharacterized protein n=1 Tax=Podospora didyma TaxID=330526 RepID=A0AAE0K6G8_9PEZI|nr:hypothetical protein B0H63DRAFT_552650 [Podospora didyma]
MEPVRRKALPPGASRRLLAIGRRQQPPTEESSFFRANKTPSNGSRLSQSTTGLSLLTADTSAAVALMIDLEQDANPMLPLPPIKPTLQVPQTVSNGGGGDDVSPVSELVNTPRRFTVSTMHTLSPSFTTRNSPGGQTAGYQHLDAETEHAYEALRLQQQQQHNQNQNQQDIINSASPLSPQRWQQRWHHQQQDQHHQQQDQHHQQQDQHHQQQNQHHQQQDQQYQPQQQQQQLSHGKDMDIKIRSETQVISVPVGGREDKKRPAGKIDCLLKRSKGHRRKSRKIPEMWNPFWLRRVTLISFAALSAALALTTGLLYHFASVSNGLGERGAGYNGVWRYSPTAVVVVVSSLWRLVDLNVRSLMPWYELQHGPTSAEKSLLLDYMTPFLPRRFWLAFKNRHWAAVASMVGYIVLLLLVVFSTGLVALEPTSLSGETLAPIASRDEAATRSSLFSTENRLHVKGASTGLLCVGFILLTIISIAVLFTRPQDVVVREPGSVQGMARVLSTSPELGNALAGLGSNSEAEIRETLQNASFVSRLTRSKRDLNIEAINGSATPMEMPEKRITDPPIQRWHPLAISDWFLGCALIVPLIYIAILEGAQVASNKQTGFVETTPHSSAAVIANYIPATLALVLCSMYAAIELHVAIIAPFSSLRHRTAKDSKSVSLHYLTKSSPWIWLSSLQNKHFALSTIVAANFLAAWLTIIISGLYSITSVVLTTPITLVQLDTFDLSKSNLLVSDFAPTASSSDSWIYNDLVFPSFNLSPSNTVGTDSIIQLRAVTATRAILNCASLPLLPYSISISTTGSLAGYNVKTAAAVAVVQATALVPWSLCTNPPSSVNPATDSAIWEQEFFIPTAAADGSSSSTIRVGNGLYMNWTTVFTPTTFDGSPGSGGGSNASSAFGFINSSETAAQIIARNGLDGWGCPTLGITTGTASVGTSKDGVLGGKADLQTLVCWQQVQEVEADLMMTRTYPGLGIQRDIPPVVNEATARLVRNPVSSGNEGHDFDFSVNSMMESMETNENRSGGQVQPMNAFSRAMLEGLNGFTIRDNSENLKLAAQRVYGRHMAYAISQAMRTNKAATKGEAGGEDQTMPSSSSSSLPTTTQTSTSTRDSFSPTLSPTSIPDRGSTDDPDLDTPITLNFPPGVFPPIATSSVARGLQNRAAEPTRVATAALLSSLIPDAAIVGTSSRISTRLQQNPGPKVALQVLLGMMMLAVVVMRVMMGTHRETLSHEPVSIAGMASLVVDGVCSGDLNIGENVSRVPTAGGPLWADTGRV